jgi:hypothetical protein
MKFKGARLRKELKACHQISPEERKDLLRQFAQEMFGSAAPSPEPDEAPEVRNRGLSLLNWYVAKHVSPNHG